MLWYGLAVGLLMAAALIIADRFVVSSWVIRAVAERRMRITSELSVYKVDGELLATNVQPPVPAPARDTWTSLSERPQTVVQDGLVMNGVFRDGAFAGVVVRRILPTVGPYPGPPLALVLGALAGCVAASVLLSAPLARSVVQPVEALAQSVERFGEGQLSTRVLSKRKDEIGALAATFDEMASRVEARVLREKRLVANVSHELRTPLARIHVLLELARDGDATRLRSYLSEIAADIADLEELVDDVLTTAKLDIALGRLGDAGLPLRWTTANIGPIVVKSRARFARLHPDEHLEVVAEGALPDLRCDPRLLRRVVDNLLDNAAKYAKGSRIELHARADAEDVWIRVTDQGAGMSPEVAARAFEPFFRADENHPDGVGLGLATVRWIIEAHAGAVTLESAPGHGTSVTARIPRSAGASSDRPNDDVTNDRVGDS